jgi:branched-chain amino acid transport system ATP-binding protein
MNGLSKLIWAKEANVGTKVLEIQNLSVGYGEIEVLHDVSIHLDQDERIGLFGPNGHGKTTLLRTISGLSAPWQGQILFRGERIDGLKPKRIVEKGIIHVSQGNTLFPRMTVLENLSFAAFPKKSWSKRKERVRQVFDLFPRLAERRGQLCRTLSGGERQMLAIGMGLMTDVEVLMLDEPTLGLAPNLKDFLRETISKIAARGISIVLVEQDVEFMLDLTDRLYLIEGGRVALEITPDKVNDEEILSMYFGRALVA